jgi:hypothetical protein
MKKTVIKRRKRVPAAGGISAGRMTDQAAAETLVAVGRLGVGVGGGGGGADESDGEVAEQPKRKRARKGRGAGRRDSRDDGLGDEDVGMEGSDEEVEERERERERERPLQNRRRSRESNGSTTWDLAALQQQPENAHPHGGTNGSPPRAQSVSRLQSGEYQHLQRSSSHGQQQQQFVGSPHPHHGGFDLPPLNAALGGGAGGFGAYGAGIMGGSRDYVSGAPSSYIRSGSSAPSRTHSPLGPAAATGAGYVLPPPHGLHAHGLGQHMYYGLPAGMSPLHAHSPPPVDSANGTSSPSVPTISELKRHYDELHEQRKKLEEMVEKNERMMAGVKRGLDEMRGVHQPPSQGGGGAAALPLMRDPDRPRSRASVWPLDSTARD